MNIIYYYIIGAFVAVISLISVVITISDKRKAIKGKWRVPEATLLGFSALGGSIAMFLTMLAIRHKTKHLKFMVGIPIIMTLQAVGLFFLFRYLPPIL